VRQKGTLLHSVPENTATGLSASTVLPVKSARKEPVSRLKTSKGPRRKRTGVPARSRSRNGPPGMTSAVGVTVTVVSGAVPTMVMKARISAGRSPSGLSTAEYCCGYPRTR